MAWTTEMRLDQLEPLVRERRGVDRDLRAHVPRGMRQRVVGSDVQELVARAASERAAGCREHERVDGVDVALFQTLERRRVLAVDGKQSAAAAHLRGEREVARGDEALLVRKREVDAALERPQRRRKPGEPDDRVQHEVRLRPVEQLREVAADLRVRRKAVDRPRS
jgi:hypothetical protein